LSAWMRSAGTSTNNHRSAPFLRARSFERNQVYSVEGADVVIQSGRQKEKIKSTGLKTRHYRGGLSQSTGGFSQHRGGAQPIISVLATSRG
jgi:hypothetical protein